MDTRLSLSPPTESLGTRLRMVQLVVVKIIWKPKQLWAHFVEKCAHIVTRGSIHALSGQKKQQPRSCEHTQYGGCIQHAYVNNLTTQLSGSSSNTTFCWPMQTFGCTSLGLCRVFSRDVVLGGKLILWGEKMWKISKKQMKFVLVWGGNSKLGGGISPPKGPE